MVSPPPRPAVSRHARSNDPGFQSWKRKPRCPKNAGISHRCSSTGSRSGCGSRPIPPSIYGLTGGYPLGRGIRQSELEGATPYNTYVIAGLPPDRICNPGKDSIAAVLNPQASDDLYFVATGHGGHAFASSVAEQARNVAALSRLRTPKPGPPRPAG